VGYELWQGHRHWPELYAMLEWGNAEEIRQMDLLLMLTRCESLLAETAAPDPA